MSGSGTRLPCSFRGGTSACDRKRLTFGGVPKAEFDPEQSFGALTSFEVFQPVRGQNHVVGK